MLAIAVALVSVAAQPVQFSVTATGTGTLTYQWQRNGQNISSATASSYSLGNPQTTDAGDFRVIVSNSAGNTTSLVAKLTVNAAVNELRIVRFRRLSANVFETDLSVPTGRDYVLEGTSDFITWTTARLFTAAQSTLTVRATNAPAVVRLFRVRPATVIPTGPVILQQPQDVSALVGDTVTFSVTVEGAGPFTYQWLRNGAPLATRTAATLVLTRVRLVDAGKYSVIVTSPTGSTTSNEVILTVEM